MIQAILDRKQVLWCYAVGKRKADRFATFPGAKYKNTPSTQIIGKIGEVAAYLYFKRSGWRVEHHFEDDDQMPDLTLSGNRAVEVKTWDDFQWMKYGRSIQEEQVGKLRDYWVIIWCSCQRPPDIPPESYTVTIRGFSYPQDFFDVIPKVMGPDKILNRQIGFMHRMTEL